MLPSRMSKMELKKNISERFPDSRVYIVEDDHDSVETIRMYLKSEAIDCEVYQTGETFLENLNPAHFGCVLADYRLGGMNGLEIQDELIRNGSVLPVIVISGFADVQVAVSAMRRGAITLLQKPFTAQELIQAVAEAFVVDRKRRQKVEEKTDAIRRLATMTDEERFMIWAFLDGQSNREVANQLGIAQRTMERRKQRMFKKAGVESLVELAELVKLAGWQRPDDAAPETRNSDNQPDDPKSNQPE